MSTRNPAQQVNGQFSQSQFSNPQHWNGSDGAVQALSKGGANSGYETPGTTALNPHALLEQKRKAKEAMASAGFGSTVTSAQHEPGITADGPMESDSGRQLSRKRSRDGTQIPVNRPPPNKDDAVVATPSHGEVLLDRYQQRDLLHAAWIMQQEDRNTNLLRYKQDEHRVLAEHFRRQRMVDPGSIFGYGYMGYGNRTTDQKNQIVWSTMRGPPKGRRARQIHISRKANNQQADQHEELVPVRLDIELDKLRLRDTFTWNLHERNIPPDAFIDYLLEDLKIPPESMMEVGRLVKAEMIDQIGNFYPHIVVEDGPVESGRPYYDHKDDELRIQIKLNITIGRITLVDQFEWDINNPLNSPEEFARQMASENALSGEFTTAIAHSIREQAQLYTRSLYLTNHCFDGRPVEDPELRDSFLPAPVNSAFRPFQAQKDWTPYMYEMSEAELERTEVSMSREHRANKRQLNRRGGPALPDLKDRQRTVRALVVHSVIPGAVEAFEMTGISKTRRSGRGGRRAGTRPDGDVDSDELDSDDSGADSPAPSMINAGTARTRGMRGAASAAQAAMRANFGRSATPDSQMAGTPHETRTSTRRSALRDESVADDDGLIVKLKIGKARLKSWWDAYRANKRAANYPLSGYASQPPPLAVTASVATPSKATRLGTPQMTPRGLPHSRNTPQPNGQTRRQRSASATRQAQVVYDEQGRADTDHWPSADETPPPPPAWLNEAIQTLRELHPESDFEHIMRPYSVNIASGTIEKAANLDPGAPPPPGSKLQFFPRIRCNDCPGKLYTAQPGKVVDDFEVHLKNRVHRERVQHRQDSQR